MQQPYSSPLPDNETKTPVPVGTFACEDKGRTPILAQQARRVVIIHAETRRKKGTQATVTPVRHLTLHARQTIVLVTTLLVLGGTLITLFPLAPGQSNSTIFSRLSIFLLSTQSNLEIQAQEAQNAPSSSSSHALPVPLNISRSQYVAIASQDATNVGISPTYFVRQIQLESGFNPNAVSPSGAVGIAQFMPSTAAGLGINPWDPLQALQAAAKMMANLYHQYGDYAKALAAYNAGSANVNNAVSACGSSWLSCMTAETQHYVATIMG